MKEDDDLEFQWDQAVDKLYSDALTDEEWKKLFVEDWDIGDETKKIIREGGWTEDESSS